MTDRKVTHTYDTEGNQCYQEVSDTLDGLFHRLVHKETKKAGRWHSYTQAAVMVIIEEGKKTIEVGLTPFYLVDYDVLTAEEFITTLYGCDIVNALAVVNTVG